MKLLRSEQAQKEICDPDHHFFPTNTLDQIKLLLAFVSINSQMK